MATLIATIGMSVEEYLRTSFRPDVDYVDGLIEERKLGEFDHARLQGAIFRILVDREAEWNVWVASDVRVQTSATRFRVPDVCVTDGRFEVEQIVRRAPLLCVEVLSPEDRLPRLLKRVQEYHEMGVAQVWVFDPKTRQVWVSSRGGAMEWKGGILRVPGTLIELDPEDAFRRMGRQRL